MAKTFLKDFSLGGDIIDSVEKDLSEIENNVDVAHGVPKVAQVSDVADIPLNKENQNLKTSDSSEVSPPVGSGDEDVLKSEKDGLFTLFNISGTAYRIGGVKPLFVTSLRVNIRASNGSVSYYDSIDLYSSRGRSSFAQGVYRTWGAVPARIENDLVMILERLEKERDEALTNRHKCEKKIMSEEERRLGMELLQDKNLFKRITDDLTTLGYVGEELNKQLLYLCASSRKLDDPISVLIISQSASGKSFLVDTVRRLMPAEDVVAVTSLSDQALNYIEDLMHKFLILGEAVHGDTVEYQIREMLSGKELSRLVTVKDAETGRMQSEVVRTPVVVSSVMSGTNHNINPENASRCFVVNTDESREQTERIQENQRYKYSLDALQSGKETKERVIKTHHAAQRLLEKRDIVNDFAPFLNFPTSLMRTRRDHDRFLDLIACVCYLRQFQKKEETNGTLHFIKCDMEDYKIAYRIMIEGVLASTMRELPESAQIFYEQMRKFAREESAKQKLGVTEITITQRQMREFTGFSQTSVKVNIRLLLDYEYITALSGGRERSKGFYRLKSDEEIKESDLSMIPTPEAMKKLLQEKNRANKNHAE